MSKALLIFAIVFFVLFVDVMLLSMGVSSGSTAEGLSISSLVSGGNIIHVGNLLINETPIYISIFFVALNIMGIAIVILIIRGVS